MSPKLKTGRLDHADSLPDVSVVMVTYNRLERCRRAIASALGQEPSPIEVVVCDDGSTDGTLQMLTEWSKAEPRLRVLAGEHCGVPAPHRNRGIQEATGEWVAFLDDDDEWLPGKLATQARYLEDGFDVVAGNALRATTSDRYFPHAPALATPSRGALLRSNLVVTSTAVVRREQLLAVGGFDESPWLAGAEDYALWLTLVDHRARFAVLGAPLVRYDDFGADRLSTGTLRVQLSVARLFWRRWRAAPDDRALRRAALAKASYSLTVAKDVVRRRLS